MLVQVEMWIMFSITINYTSTASVSCESGTCYVPTAHKCHQDASGLLNSQALSFGNSGGPWAYRRTVSVSPINLRTLCCERRATGARGTPAPLTADTGRNERRPRGPPGRSGPGGRGQGRGEGCHVSRPPRNARGTCGSTRRCTWRPGSGRTMQ